MEDLLSRNSNYSYSISSLFDKIEKVTYSLDDNFTRYPGEYQIKEINQIIPEINSIYISKNLNTVEINYLKHKRKRHENVQSQIIEIDSINSQSVQVINLLDQEDSVDIDINDTTNNKIETLYESSIKIIKRFYGKDIFHYFSNLKDYSFLINFLFLLSPSLSHETHLFNIYFRQNSKILIDTIFNNKNFPSSFITLNKFDENSSEFIEFSNNHLYVYIFNKLENIFNTKKTISKIFLTGEIGMGKSYALMIYSLFLRMNYYNLVFTIFNIEEFLQNPFYFFSNEVLYSLYYLYTHNSSLNEKELETFFNFFNNKNSEEFFIQNFKAAFAQFKKMIEKVLEAYNDKINIYFIIDNYEKLFIQENTRNRENNPSSQNSQNLSNSLVDEIHKCKIEFIHMLENFQIIDKPNVKIIICSNTDNNDIIVERFKDLNKCVSNENINILDNRLIFLNPVKIFKDEDFFNFVERNFNFSNRNVIKLVSKWAGCNYSYITSCFNSMSREEYSYIQESHIRGYFMNIKKIELEKLVSDPNLSLEKKGLILYNLYSYKVNFVEKTHSRNDFFNKEIFKFYIYKYFYPSKGENNNIVLTFINELVGEFIISFYFEGYFKKLKLKNVNMQFYSEMYKITRDQYLQGIFIEEMTYLFFKNSKFNQNQEVRFYYHYIQNFDFYSKEILDNEEPCTYYSKVNNPSCLNLERDRIILKIEKIKKFYSPDDQIFGGDKILRFPNGIYFLNHKFPLIDALIINQDKKNMILIQIKKRMTQVLVENYLDSFHILYFLFENPDMYKKIYEYLLSKKEETNINTKLQFFMKVVHFIKLGWSVNFMFAYHQIDNSFSFISDNQILENYYIQCDKEAASFSLDDETFRRTEELLGNYKIENQNIKLYRRRILNNILMVELNDLTAGLIENKRFNKLIK